MRLTALKTRYIGQVTSIALGPSVCLRDPSDAITNQGVNFPHY
jgi:hypothetical protein